jgi:hypothetical protein
MAVPRVISKACKQATLHGGNSVARVVRTMHIEPQLHVHVADFESQTEVGPTVDKFHTSSVKINFNPAP